MEKYHGLKIKKIVMYILTPSVPDITNVICERTQKHVGGISNEVFFPLLNPLCQNFSQSSNFKSEMNLTKMAWSKYNWILNHGIQI